MIGTSVTGTVALSEFAAPAVFPVAAIVHAADAARRRTPPVEAVIDSAIPAGALLLGLSGLAHGTLAAALGGARVATLAAVPALARRRAGLRRPIRPRAATSPPAGRGPGRQP